MKLNEKKPINKSNKLMLSSVKCDFCNSNNFKFLIKSKDYLFEIVKEYFNLVKCTNCGLVFINPRLKTLDLINYYSKILTYDNKLRMRDLLTRFSILNRPDLLTYYFNYPILKKNNIKKIFQYPNYLRIRRIWKKAYFVPIYEKNGKILEIGCSSGGYLYQLKKIGWNVKGIEINKEAVEYAVNQFKIDVINKSIEDFETEILFDYVYLHNVLEHLESPKKSLEKIRSFLKPNGILVLTVPDFNGIEVRLYKKYAYTLQLPFHLYHFTPKTIKNYLKEMNFKEIKIYHQNTTRDLISPLYFKLRENQDKMFVKMIYKLLINNFIRNTLLKQVVNFLSYLGKTSRMTVVAKK